MHFWINRKWVFEKKKKKPPPRNPPLNLKNYHLHGTNERDQGTFYMVSQRVLGEGTHSDIFMELELD
jgi:hypothetical protein